MRVTALVPLFFVAQSLGKVYKQTENYQGAHFLDGFNFEDIPDPSKGRVKYVNASIAKANNLTFATDKEFVLRGDDIHKVAPDDPSGRMSVRLRSKKTYLEHVSVIDIRHMPEGCGTWPAYWYVGDNWPNNGEIDVIEGVNGEGLNRMTLHTKAGCTMPTVPTATQQTGNSLGGSTNCNNGCGVSASETSSFGSAFNAVGGGWYALERSDTAVNIWFWPRNAANVPQDIKVDGALQINPDGWGLPSAHFPGDTCDLDEYFKPLSIIINLTFCGEWAAVTFNQQGCTGDCNKFVDDNPSQFVNATFDISRLSIYSE